MDLRSEEIHNHGKYKDSNKHMKVWFFTLRKLKLRKTIDAEMVQPLKLRLTNKNIRKSWNNHQLEGHSPETNIKKATFTDGFNVKLQNHQDDS